MASAAEPETQFAIEVDGEAAGGIGLFLQQDVERYSAEIGYWLGEAYWGAGNRDGGGAPVHRLRVRRVRALPDLCQRVRLEPRVDAGCWRRPGTSSRAGCAGGGEGRAGGGRAALRDGPRL